MFPQIQHKITQHYEDLCSIHTCPLRKPFPFSYLTRLALHRVLQILILLSLAMLTSSVGTLMIVRAQVPVQERVAIIEAQQHSQDLEETRTRMELDEVRAELVTEREKRAELDSRLSVVQGVGFGLGSIVMVLQAASMLLGLKRKTEQRG